ncbi:MAG: serine/threonine protein kinase [Lentisphaerales bacterium]|nr:serine/threonine protein kinase [Lentisphaerales bacterium]
MKKIFSGLFSKKKETRQEGVDTSFEDLISFLETKSFPCSECGHFIQLDNPEPLSISPCSQCGAGNFIPDKVGPFWLYKFCGQGGMSRVYKATCSIVPGVEYAVKVLPREVRDNEKMKAALQKEAELTMLFNDHPNSVTVVECDVDDGICYIATEYIEGQTLDEFVKQKGKLTESETVMLCFQLLQIIEHIYSRGYLYRDLKPQNIMVADQMNLVLMDYGICLPKGTAAHPGNLEAEGSPHFIPPERITNEGEDIRSEIYSIGMLIYFMMTGKTYFSGANNQEIAEKHVSAKRHENLASKMPTASEDLLELTDRMIKSHKRKRVQTLDEVQAVIKYLGKKYDLFENDVSQTQAC